MNSLKPTLFAALFALTGAAHAAATTYNYTGPNYTRLYSASALGSHMVGVFTFSTDFDYSSPATQTKGLADLVSWQIISGPITIGSANGGTLGGSGALFTFEHGVIDGWLLSGVSADTRYRFQTNGVASGTYEYFFDAVAGRQNDTVGAGSFGAFARVSAVPEPASLLLMLAGGGLLLARRLRVDA